MRWRIVLSRGKPDALHRRYMGRGKRRKVLREAALWLGALSLVTLGFYWFLH